MLQYDRQIKTDSGYRKISASWDLNWAYRLSERHGIIFNLPFSAMKHFRLVNWLEIPVVGERHPIFFKLCFWCDCRHWPIASCAYREPSQTTRNKICHLVELSFWWSVWLIRNSTFSFLAIERSIHAPVEWQRQNAETEVNCEKPDVGRKGIFPTAVLVTKTKDVQVWNLGLREGPRYPLSFVIWLSTVPLGKLIFTLTPQWDMHEAT